MRNNFCISEQIIGLIYEYILSTIFMPVKIIAENMANIVTKSSENTTKIIEIKHL